MNSSQIDVPLPGGSDDSQRRRHSRLRRRLLTGHWHRDLERHLRFHFPLTRVAEFGKPDLSRNLFSTVVRQLSVLYDTTPTIGHDSASDEMALALDSAGLWQLAQRNQRSVLGARESLIRVDVQPRGDVQFRLVPPDLVFAEALPDTPDLPALLVEARPRTLPGAAEAIWTWDFFDIRNPEEPIYRVLQADDGKKPEDAKDLSQVFLGGDFSGSAYPFRHSGGGPFIPYSLYHAERTGSLWDAWTGREQVEGSLTLACLWTFFLHAVKQASWPQRYSVGAILRGATAEGEDMAARSQVAADPTSILQFMPDGTATPQLGQWQAGVDPERLEVALASFERNLIGHYDLSPGDLQRQGGAESGYAISLRREAVREAQRRFEPQFRRADLDLIQKTAALLGLPDEGWSISYPGLPKSGEEVRAEVELMRSDMDAGLASPVDLLLARRPGMTREAAVDHLFKIEAEKRQLAAAGIAVKPTTPTGGTRT